MPAWIRLHQDDLLCCGAQRFQELSFTRMVDLLGQEIGSTLSEAGNHSDAMLHLVPALNTFRGEGWNELLTAGLSIMER